MATNRDDLWNEAARRCRLDESTLQMARAMGLNPRSLIKNIPSKSEPWKAPVKQWIREMFARRQGKAPHHSEGRRSETSHERQRLGQDDRFTLKRYEQFRAAAEYVTAAFAGISVVKRIALFGSLAAGPRGKPRTRRTATIHEPKDVDLAVWIEDVTDLNRLRILLSRAVTQLWNERELGVAHHQVDVFLIDANAGRYLGRLCRFNQCPKGKPECQAQDCGKLPFLRQHDDFVFDHAALDPSRIEVLYDRDVPHLRVSEDEIPF